MLKFASPGGAKRERSEGIGTMSDDPLFGTVDGADPEYQASIRYARESLCVFRQHCLRMNRSGAMAFLKKEVVQGDRSTHLWFSDIRPAGSDFEATVFEVPSCSTLLRLGQRVTIRAGEVLDWMVNDGGRLHGGFSLRCQRRRLPPERRAWFDHHIGVIEYV